MNQDHKKEVYSEGCNTKSDAAVVAFQEVSKLRNVKQTVFRDTSDIENLSNEEVNAIACNANHNTQLNQGNETAKFQLTESEEKELKSLEKAGFGSQLTEEQEKNWEQWVKTQDMNKEDNDCIWSEGYSAFQNEKSELANPYSGIDAEYWSDGWEDAKEDEEQDQKRQPSKAS